MLFLKEVILEFNDVKPHLDCCTLAHLPALQGSSLEARSCRWRLCLLHADHFRASNKQIGFNNNNNKKNTEHLLLPLVLSTCVLAANFQWCQPDDAYHAAHQARLQHKINYRISFSKTTPICAQTNIKACRVPST